MKTLALLLLMMSVSTWAQVNPSHPTIVCSGNNEFFDGFGAGYSVIFDGPSWGSKTSIGYNQSSFKVLSRKVTGNFLIYGLKENNSEFNEPAELLINLKTGLGVLKYELEDVKNYICKSSTTRNIDLFDFLKMNKMPDMRCDADGYNCKLVNPM